jgi:DNA gyrase/topoisomerase IV subunit B
MAQKEVDEKYKKHELRDHIYQLPDTYIGSVESAPIDSYVYDDTTNRMVKKTLTYVPGLFKIFDEIVVNALDHAMRLKDEVKKGKKDVKPVKQIRISIDKSTGYIEITNDGDGIDVEKHSSYDMYIPQLIFGELLTSTNYDQDMEKLWGGKNGYGSKLTNIFSKEFTVETVDHRRGKKYTQRWSDNMKKVDKASIKASSKTPFTTIRFLPDYVRFGLKGGLTDDIYELFHKRALDACATTDPAVAVYFNEKKLDIKNFEKYVDLYIGPKDDRPRAMETCGSGDRWEVVATYSDGQFEQVSFVNGINTSRGGKHIDYITAQITKRLGEMIASKTKKEVKSQHIKDNLAVFVKCLIVNPSFDTQTKDALTTPSAKFGSKCELSDKFMTTLYKTGIAEKAVSLTEFHQEKKVAKTDGKKTNRVIVPKLDDANFAGTKYSQECTLILTEGDSAKTMAIAGLSVVGRDRYGVFPLRGKILNAKDAGLKKIAENEEITNLKKILALQQGKNYTDLSQLRYGKVLIMTDQDSVTGDTPLLLRKDNHIHIKTIEDLTTEWNTNINGKEYGITDYEVWSDNSWTKIKHVMRHKVTKDIYRVLTHTGVVDVTEDHSLLDKNGNKISPKEIKVGEELLHNFPLFEENKVFIPDNLQNYDYSELCKFASECKIRYYQKLKKSEIIEELNKIKNTPHMCLIPTKLGNTLKISQDEAWVMGFFWADGTSGIYSWDYEYKNKNRPRAYTHRRNSYSWAISNCDKSLLEKAKELLENDYDYNFKIIEDRSNQKKNPNCQLGYKLIINGGIKTKDFVEKYTNLFYYKNKHPRFKNGNKYIPAEILNESTVIREEFLKGYYAGDGFQHDITQKSLNMDVDSKISAQSLYYLCKSLGYEVSINHQERKLNVYTLNITKGTQQNNSNIIKKIFKLSHKEDQYVYDLETENHHFQAGIGQMIVHNTDGYHIKGLVFNLFESLWPSLYKMDGFLTSMRTPIVKVTHTGGDTVSFYNLPDYEKWRELTERGTGGLRGWKIKYYKGLGTSKESEAKEYFSNLKITTYHYNTKTSDESLDLAFNKKRADDRKEWLMKYDRDDVLDYKNDTIPYEEFVHKELIHFSNRDLERSISCMCDGFKESNRKIMFGCFKRKLFKDEIKVAQLAAYISEVSAYHHGETSLQQAITGMAQIYVGANNANLLQPNGQFGTRIQGGNDSASPRYIYTVLTKIARTVFRDEDLPILEYLNDDGLDIEPTYYIPIIPMALINGAIGIGTGFSTNVPCHNPSDVIDHCERIIDKLNNTPATQLIDTQAQLKEACDLISKIKLGQLIPWYLGFQGEIVPYKEGSFASRGKYTWIDDQTVHITELPIGTWTEDYKDYLEGMVANGSPVLKDFENHYTAKNVKFILKLFPGVRSTIEKDFELEFKLATSKNLSLNNIHLYTEEGAIKKYKDTNEVVRDWAKVRITKYFDRKKYQLKSLEKQYTLLSAKVRFIQDIIDQKISIMNRKIKEVDAQLAEMKYPTLVENDSTQQDTREPTAAQDDGDQPTKTAEVASYGYLTRMPIHQLTFEKKRALEKEADAIRVTIEELRAKPLQKIWYDELQEFKAAWLEHKAAIDEEYESDRQNRPAASPKRKTSKK